ncbi:uncharacterized protein N7482_005288 [Penicillium canariense]|uniref:RRM domain-containing protein n=1 Tax=Penicillium canariense TaxID=189055 RepID=A0A9W9I6A6_9EURO|nr:uncharacterized protein N7482_005288 [Penicillium canariense]KAJ5166507.1 hypothetical protein N7482_005288 [Penicillium canariense]
MSSGPPADKPGVAGSDSQSALIRQSMSFAPWHDDPNVQPAVSPAAGRALDYRNPDLYAAWGLLHGPQQPTTTAPGTHASTELLDYPMHTASGGDRAYSASGGHHAWSATAQLWTGSEQIGYEQTSQQPPRPGYTSHSGFAVPRHPGKRHSLRNVSRHYLVKNVSTDIEGLQLLVLFESFESKEGPFIPELNTKGRFFVGFGDMNEAKRAYSMLENHYQDWVLIPVSVEDFNRENRLSAPLPPSFDDRVLAIIYCGGQSRINASNIVTLLKPYFEKIGKVLSIQELLLGVPAQSARLVTYELVVRYFVCSHALNAIKALNSIRTEDFVIEITPWHPNIESQPIRHWTSSTKMRRMSHPSHYSGNQPNRGYISPGDADSSPIPHRDTGRDCTIDLGKIFYRQDDRTSGKDALVEKFRNSPVILNAHHNRPKLFHLSGPRAGCEATFPPVNNFYTLAKGVDRSKRSGNDNRPSRFGFRTHRYGGSECDSPAFEELHGDRGNETRDVEMDTPFQASRADLDVSMGPPSHPQGWSSRA